MYITYRNDLWDIIQTFIYINASQQRSHSAKIEAKPTSLHAHHQCMYNIDLQFGVEEKLSVFFVNTRIAAAAS